MGSDATTVQTVLPYYDAAMYAGGTSGLGLAQTYTALEHDQLQPGQEILPEQQDTRTRTRLKCNWKECKYRAPNWDDFELVSTSHYEAIVTRLDETLLTMASASS